jgi:hypothetical protein
VEARKLQCVSRSHTSSLLSKTRRLTTARAKRKCAFGYLHRRIPSSRDGKSGTCHSVSHKSRVSRTRSRCSGVTYRSPRPRTCFSHYSGKLVCEHNSFRKRARNPKNSYIKVNFPIKINGNSDDSFQNPKISI